MRVATVIGIILIILGIISLIFQGISYTKEKQILDIGPLKAKTQERKTIPIPPIVGGVMLAAGVVLLLAGGRSRAR